MQELLYRLPILEVFNSMNESGLIRIHGLEDRFTNIRTEIEGGIGIDYVVVDRSIFPNVLDVIEAANVIIRGRYNMTYEYHTLDHHRITERTNRDWCTVCNYDWSWLDAIGL